MRPFGRISMVLFAAGSLAACTEVVDLTTESRYAQYKRTTDWAKNEAILLNIIRASEKQPLNFLVYQAYTGTATASGCAATRLFVASPTADGDNPGCPLRPEGNGHAHRLPTLPQPHRSRADRPARGDHDILTLRDGW